VGAKRTSRAPGGAVGGGRQSGRRVTIYVLSAGKAAPVDVQLGITDGSKTEVRGDELKENDAVIIGMSSGAGSQNQPAVVNPFQPAQPRGFFFR
jgi:HlyD family secretion protein